MRRFFQLKTSHRILNVLKNTSYAVLARTKGFISNLHSSIIKLSRFGAYRQWSYSFKLLKNLQELIYTQFPQKWPFLKKLQYFPQFLTKLDEIFTDRSWLFNQYVKLISVHFDHVLGVPEVLRFEAFQVFSFFLVANELAI